MGAYLLYLIQQGTLAFEYAGDDPGACGLLASHVGGMAGSLRLQLPRHAPALCLPADEEAGGQQSACYPCAGAKGHHGPTLPLDRKAHPKFLDEVYPVAMCGYKDPTHPAHHQQRETGAGLSRAAGGPVRQQERRHARWRPTRCECRAIRRAPCTALLPDRAPGRCGSSAGREPCRQLALLARTTWRPRSAWADYPPAGGDA